MTRFGGSAFPCRTSCCFVSAKRSVSFLVLKLLLCRFPSLPNHRAAQLNGRLFGHSCLGSGLPALSKGTAGGQRKARSGHRSRGSSERPGTHQSAPTASTAGDDKPKFTIHNLPNASRSSGITPGAVIGTYGTVGKKSRNRFKKQRNDYSLLIPGDCRLQPSLAAAA